MENQASEESQKLLPSEILCKIYTKNFYQVVRIERHDKWCVEHGISL